MRHRAAVGAVLAGILFSGTSLPGWCQVGPVVRIGHVAPLSGPMALSGTAAENGARMAVDELNAGRFQLGSRRATIELIRFDDASDPRQAAAIAQKLCGLKVAGVVGHLNPGTAAAASGIYNECGIPNIVPSANAGSVAGKGFESTFRLYGSEAATGDRLAHFAAERMSIKRVLIHHDRTAYGSEAAERFKSAARLRGIEVVEPANHSAAPEFSELIRSIRPSKSDAIFFGGRDDHAALMLQQMVAAGLGRVPVLGPDQICTQRLARALGALRAKRVVCAIAGPAVGQTAAGRQWRSQYADRYGSLPSDEATAAATYDAVMVLVDAMRRADTSDPKVYLRFLRDTRYRGVTSSVRFHAGGGLIDPPVTLYEIDSRGMTVAGSRDWIAKFPTAVDPESESGHGGESAPESGLPPAPRNPRPSPPAPPAPAAPVPPPPQPTWVSDAPVPGIFWNSWVQDADGPVKKLEVGEAYDLAVDLSRYRYSVERGAPAGTALSRAVGEALDAGQKEIQLVVRPALAGSALERPPGAPPDYRITVDLTKLARPDASEREADRATWAGYNAAELPLAELSRRFRAAGLIIPLRTVEKGCAQVALSIWDRKGMRPLDHLVHTIPVGATDACGTVPGGVLQAGTSTLLESLPHPGAAGADAALHLFDLPSGTRHKAVAIFVDGGPAKKGGEPVLYAWRLESGMGDYLTDPAKLLVLLVEARRSGSYAAAASELKKKLFNDDPARPGEADAALQALKRVAKASQDQAVVLVRAVSASGTPVYLPLSLLAATSSAPILERAISVVHPSPEPSRVAPGCVAPWTFAIPSTLDKLGAVALPEEDVTFIGKRRRESMERFRQYLGEGSASPVKGQAAEGLILLAHHDKGNIWFEKNSDRVVIEDLKRSFSPGSIAVLSACSAANPGGDNDQWVRKISAQGVDAIIASPFPVPMEFGVALARELVGVVRSASDARETPSVVTLFARASDRAAAQLKRAGKQADDVRLEFVLIGDHGIRMCKEPQ